MPISKIDAQEIITNTIKSWNGKIKSGDLQKVKEKENISTKGNIKFEGIGEFSHDKGYLFNVGKLFWKRDDWEKFVIQPL